MKDKILLWLLLVFSIAFICFLPSIRKGMRITSLQQQLIVKQEDRKRCEQVQLSGHVEAEAIRTELNTMLGLAKETVSPQRTIQTWTQAQGLSWYIIE